MYNAIIWDAHLKKTKHSKKETGTSQPQKCTEGAQLHDCSGDRCIVSKLPSFFKNQPVKAGFFVLSAQKQWIIPDFADFPEKRIAKDFVGLFRILTQFPVARRLTRKWSVTYHRLCRWFDLAPPRHIVVPPKGGVWQLV